MSEGKHCLIQLSVSSYRIRLQIRAGDMYASAVINTLPTNDRASLRQRSCAIS